MNTVATKIHQYKNRTPSFPQPTILIERDGEALHFLGSTSSEQRTGNAEKVEIWLKLKYNWSNDLQITVYAMFEDGFKHWSHDHIAYGLGGGKTYTAVAFRRAIELGIFEVKTYFAGFSEIKLKEVAKAYRESDYWQAWSEAYYSRESWLFESNGKSPMEVFTEQWEKDHGPAPKSERDSKYDFFVFADEDEAKRYCPQGKGMYEMVEAVNEYHLRTIMGVKRLDLRYKRQ